MVAVLLLVGQGLEEPAVVQAARRAAPSPARAATARGKSSRLSRARATRLSSQNLRLSRNAALSFSSSLASRRYVRELGGGSLLDIGIYPLSFCSLAYGGFSFLSMVLGEGRRRG